MKAPDRRKVVLAQNRASHLRTGDKTTLFGIAVLDQQLVVGELEVVV